MNFKSIKGLTIKADCSIKNAVRSIDEGEIGTIYVIDSNNKLIGTVRDGDIREVILKGQDISLPVEKIMNNEPIAVSENELNNSLIAQQMVRRLLYRSETSIYIPVVNSEGVLLKLAPCYEIVKYIGGEQNRLSSSVKNVLIVGGAGYLGSVLCRKLLDKGYKVKVLDCLLFGDTSISELKSNKNFELIIGDLRNISVIVTALSDVDAVVNLAAIVGDPASNKRPEMTIETNYLANMALAEACKYNQINRFVYASTCSVYGLGNAKLDESSELNPVSLYARSKIKSEEGVLGMLDGNFSPCILRMSTLFGFSPRMRFDLVVNTMTMKAVTESKITVFGGDQWRPLLHVKDAAEAFIRCIEAPIVKIRGEVFNVGSEQQNYQIKTLGEIVSQMIPGAKLEIRHEATDKRDYIVSFDKIYNELGFKASVDIQEAINEMAINVKLVTNPNDKIYYNVETM